MHHTPAEHQEICTPSILIVLGSFGCFFKEFLVVCAWNMRNRVKIKY